MGLRQLMIGLTSVVLLSGATALPELWNLGSEAFYKGNYLAKITALEAYSIAYMNSEEQRWNFAAELGQSYSFVGEYKQAIKTHELAGLPSDKMAFQQSVKDLTLLPAKSIILEQAKNRQIVMLNEAHHVPRHRAFTLSLLKYFYQLGFRYLALEALMSFSSKLDPKDLPDLAKRGYPQFGTTGLYTDEPVMGELVRQALKLGYTLVRYEEKEPECTPPNPEDWVFCLNRRDKEQAQNIYDEIFKKDKNAKVLIHAGYSHIEEKSSSKGWRFMAVNLKEMTGIDPLTIDQVRLTSTYYGKRDNQTGFNALMKTYQPKEPVVFKYQNGQYFVASKPYNGKPSFAVDMQVLHPPAQYRGGRPLWLQQERKLFPTNPDLCENKFPCVFEARYSQEKDNPVPADIVMLRGYATQTSLALRKGNYRVSVKDKKGQLITTYFIKNQ